MSDARPDPPTGHSSHEERARSYLAEQFGGQAPERLVLVRRFDANPLEGEGPVSIFAFSATLEDEPPAAFHVVAGDTTPNYYPDWNLTPEEIFALHLGTRFMLVMEVGQCSTDTLPGDLERGIRDTLERVAPGEDLAGFERVAGFGFEDQRHAVCRCRIGEEEVYAITGDLPVGFERRIDLPPHVVYRLHLGRVILMETA